MPEPTFVTETRDGYNAFAAEYQQLFGDIMGRNHWERLTLRGFAESVRAAPGPVIEVGAGTGVVTAFLKDLGLDITGLELSENMLEIARRKHPRVPFTTGSMTELQQPGHSLAGLVAWYSIIHVPGEHLPAVFAEFHRVLRPGGLLLLAFQVGNEDLVTRDITFRRRQPAAVVALLREAGFELELETVRAGDGTEKTPQAYLVARSGSL